MKREDIRKMAHDIIESGAVESDYIEYKKSAGQGISSNCLWLNNYMNREIGLILLWKSTTKKTVRDPMRPISG